MVLLDNRGLCGKDMRERYKMMRVLGFCLGILFIAFFSYSLIYIQQELTGYILGSLSLLLGFLFVAYGIKGNGFVNPIIQKVLMWRVSDI